MAGVWFTSDLHLFHRAMAWYRFYGRWPTEEDRQSDRFTHDGELVQWHNDMLAARWDATVRKGDKVWVCGDLTANSSFLDPALEWIKQRPGTKHLVLGNHDPAHPMHRDSHQWEWRYHRYFHSVGTSRERNIVLPDGTKHRLLLSHFPYTGDGDLQEDRATQHRLRDEGRLLVHGHVHTEERLTFSQSRSPAGFTPQIHVGVDAWSFYPVSLEQVVQLAAQGVAERTFLRPQCICSGQGGSVYSADCPIHDSSVDRSDPAWRSRYIAHLEAQARIKERLGW